MLSRLLDEKRMEIFFIAFYFFNLASLLDEKRMEINVVSPHSGEFPCSAR